MKVLLENTDHSISERVHDGSAPEGKVMVSPKYPETFWRDSTNATVKTIKNNNKDAASPDQDFEENTNKITSVKHMIFDVCLKGDGQFVLSFF